MLILSLAEKEAQGIDVVKSPGPCFVTFSTSCYLPGSFLSAANDIGSEDFQEVLLQF